MCTVPLTSTSGCIGAMNEESLTKALNKLFDGSKNSISVFQQQQDHTVENHKNAFAFAIPTFQTSKDFAKRNSNLISFPQDMKVIRDTLRTVRNCFPNSSVYISSAYLNPTPLLMSAIEKFSSSSNKNDSHNSLNQSQNDNDKVQKRRKDGGASFLLSASPTSHGFRPKNKDDAVNGSGRDWIPSVFLKLAEDIHFKIKQNGGKILLYHREGYTFHAKGIWVTSGCDTSSRSYLEGEKGKSLGEAEIADPESDLIASIIGSSNFGSRSEVLDWESNCLLVLNPSACDKKSNNVKAAIAGDWNNMLKDCLDLGSREDLKSSSTMSVNDLLSNVATQIARKFF